MPGIGCQEADGYIGAWHARVGEGAARAGLHMWADNLVPNLSPPSRGLPRGLTRGLPSIVAKEFVTTWVVKLLLNRQGM